MSKHRSVLEMRKQAWCAVFDAMEGNYKPFCIAVRDVPIDLVVQGVAHWTKHDVQSFAAFCAAHPLTAHCLAQKVGGS